MDTSELADSFSEKMNNGTDPVSFLRDIISKNPSNSAMSSPTRSCSPSPASSTTGRLVIALDDSMDGAEEPAQEAIRENSPEKPALAKKPLTRGFMDSDDDEPYLPPVSTVNSATVKVDLKKSLFDDSDEEESAVGIATSSSRISPPRTSENRDVSEKIVPKKVLTWSDSDEDEDFVVKDVEKDSGHSEPVSPRNSPVKIKDGVKAGKMAGKPRKERVSKKRAMQEMEDLHRETQRLLRETKVRLPKFIPVKQSFDEFFEEMRWKPPQSPPKPAKAPVITLDDDDEDSAKPPARLSWKEFQNLKSKARPPPAKSSYDELFDDPAATSKPSSESSLASSVKQGSEINSAQPPEKPNTGEVHHDDVTSGEFSDRKSLTEKSGPAEAFPVVSPESIEFAKEIMASKIGSKKPNFIDLRDDGDEQPAPPKPSKLDSFINRFLKHARPARPTAGSAADSLASPAGSGNPDASQLPVKLSMAQIDRMQKPGTKLAALKAILEEKMEDTKEKVMELRVKRALEEEERRREHNEEEMEAGEASGEEEEEMMDGEDAESDTTESEPDEAEIVGDDYGRDQPEAPENDFELAEAEEASEDELSAAEEDEEILSEDEANDSIKRLACDEDEDPLAGLGDINEKSPKRPDEDSNGSSGSYKSAFTDGTDQRQEPNRFVESLDADLEPDERDRMNELFGAFFDNDGSQMGTLGTLPLPSEEPSAGKSFRPLPYEKDLMGSLESAGQDYEMMALLSCSPGDFKTCKQASPASKQPTASTPELRPHPRNDQNDDVVKKAKKAGRRALLEDSDEEQEKNDHSPVPPAPKDDSDSEGVASDAENETPEKPFRRIIRTVSDSDMEDDADDEEDEEEEENEEAEGDFMEKSHDSPKFHNIDEEMEYLERQFQPDQPLKAENFFEAEAELSDDDFRGSDDEDEDGLDELRPEDLAFHDDRHYSLKKQLREVLPEYMRKMGEDDEELEEQIKERFIREDDNLPQLPSISYGEGITFRLNDDGDVIDEENGDPEDAEDNAWRIKRFEREEMLASASVDLLTKGIPLPTTSHSVSHSTADDDEAFNARQSELFAQSLQDGTGTGTFKRNSILSRGKAVLARLNEVINVEERKTAPLAILAMQSVEYRKSLSLDADTNSIRKLQRTESMPADYGPSAKRLRTGYQSLQRKPSVFSVLGK